MPTDTLIAERDLLRLQLRDALAQRDEARLQRDVLLQQALPPAMDPGGDAADLEAVRRVAALAHRCRQFALARRLVDLAEVMADPLTDGQRR